MLSNTHTPLIAHAADDSLTICTGSYGDRHGQPVSNSYKTFNPDGSSDPAGSFAYPVTDAAGNLIYLDGRTLVRIPSPASPGSLVSARPRPSPSLTWRTCSRAASPSPTGTSPIFTTQPRHERVHHHAGDRHRQAAGSRRQLLPHQRQGLRRRLREILRLAGQGRHHPGEHRSRGTSSLPLPTPKRSHRPLHSFQAFLLGGLMVMRHRGFRNALLPVAARAR